MSVKNKKYRSEEAKKFWFPLDNAAKIFPAILTDEFTAVFRLTAILNHPIKIKPFFRAVSLTEKRFPYFKVRLKQGFFWYYLEHFPYPFPVLIENDNPCKAFSKKGLLVRVLVKRNKVSVEFSHILTDGAGAFEFFKTLLINYSKEVGLDIPKDFEYLKPGNKISPGEYEDSYKRYFKEGIPPMVKSSKAFHIPWPLNAKPRFKILNIRIPINDIKSAASNKSVSITDYIVSVYLFVMQNIYEERANMKKRRKLKKIRIQVPVNLRNIFPSKTMRNFSLFVMPEIDPRLGHYSFDEIIKSVYHQIRLQTEKKLINKNISRNVGSELKIYIKSIPLFLKSLILRWKYYTLGTDQYSGVITNLGKVKLPHATSNMVDRFIFTPPPPNKKLKISCGIIGFDNFLVLSFSNTTKSTILEEKFIQFIKNQGIIVKHEPN